MGIKYNSKFKKILIRSAFLFSISSFSIASGVSIADIYKTNTESLNNNLTNSLTSTQAETSSNTVTENITGFDSYDLLSSSTSIAPIVTANGSIGMTKDKKSLTLTTFDGILVWNKIFANDSTIKEFYSQNYSNQSVSNIVVNNYIYIDSIDCIAILLGTSSYTNQALFAINMSTGTLFDPITSNDTINNIVKVNDDIKHLYKNSNGDIIATKGNTYTDYVNSQYISMSSSIGISSVSMTIPKDTANNTSDYLLTIVNGKSGVNFAVFISNELTNNSRQVYVVVVDDYLTPVLNRSAKISMNLGTYTPTDSSSSSTIDWTDILTYQTSSFNYSTTNKTLDFFVVISGNNSSLYKMSYNITTMSLTKAWDYTSSNDSFNFFSFNSSSNKIYISNKKSQNAYATGYVDLTASTAKFVALEIDKTNWNSSTYVFSKTTKEIPIISTNKLSVPDPYIVIVEGSSPTAKYFINSTDIYNKPLSFKSYIDPATTYKNSYGSTYVNLPSSVVDSNLISSLKFSDSSFKPTIAIENRSNDNANGTLTFNYKVTYENWYATGTNYSFYIAVTLSGFYATNKISFSWVTGLTGDTTNDTKWKKILELKANSYSYNITKQNVIDYFANLSGTDPSGNKLSLTQNMITLSPDSSGYSLTVTIDISQGHTFPSGVTTKYSYTYSGFKTISGYDYKISTTAKNDISSLYPSQLTLSLFLTNFVTLGSKWSALDSDWTFTLNANNLTGTATVTLTYKGSNSDFPTSQSKTIVNSQTFSGFNTIPKQFSSGLSISEYDGILSPIDLWTDYTKNPTASVLFSSLKFPYISNNSNLTITCSNLDTADSDGYLTLNVSINVGTQTSLYVPGYGQFTYDESAKQQFKQALGSDTFTVKWVINQTTQTFNWVYNNTTDSNSSSIIIDLNNQSFDGINKNMYANEVTEESIQKLYSQTGYSVNESMYANVSQGTLTVVLNLKVKGTQDSSTGATETKTILITGFKVPLLTSTSTILFTFLGVICFLIALSFILILLYMKRRAFNYRIKKNKKLKPLKKIK